MWPLALALSALIGVSLGLLGGGGSILTVPILVYVLKVAPKDAIALSLLVVGVTSLAALAPHARAGRVMGRTGLAFGGAGMVGAYLGGQVARFVPGRLLLVGFALMMVATAIAMLRGRTPAAQVASPHKASLVRVLPLGAAVGLLAGLIGAGGGFLIVPALVLFAGLPIDAAIGTSLVVIAMNSLAGFAGHLAHATIDWRLAGVVTGAAVAGCQAGALLGRSVPREALRQAFGWFVLVMGLYVVSHQLPGSVREHPVFRAVLTDRWPFWVGGLALGAFVVAFLVIDTKLLGIATGCAELCRLGEPEVRRSWRPGFLAGIVLGGLAAALLGGAAPTWSMGTLDRLLAAVPHLVLPLLLVAGALVGYGSRWAGGCTSGHSIVGVAQGARSSITATVAFLAGGFVTTQLLVRIFG